MRTKRGNGLAKNAAPWPLPAGDLSRAGFLRLAVGFGAALVGHGLAAAQTRDEGKAMLTRPIPSSGEALPVIGCGTYVGFDVDAGSHRKVIINTYDADHSARTIGLDVIIFAVTIHLKR